MLARVSSLLGLLLNTISVALICTAAKRSSKSVVAILEVDLHAECGRLTYGVSN